MINLEQFAMGTFVLIGLVNGIQFALDKKWGSFIKFLTAVIGGALFGYLQFFGLPSLEIGIFVGIGSSGVYKAVSKLNGQ